VIAQTTITLTASTNVLGLPPARWHWPYRKKDDWLAQREDASFQDHHVRQLQLNSR